MTTYYRKKNIILADDNKTVVESFKYVNEAKRHSLKLRKSGNAVFISVAGNA